MNMEQRASVCAIILSWNGKDEVSRFLRTLARQTYSALDIVVVDNGSTDGSPDAIRTEFPSAHLIENGRNLGFAGGMNRGIEYALSRGHNYAWLLNTDLALSDDALEVLLAKTSAITRLGLVSPLVVNSEHPDRWVWCGGDYDIRIGRMIPWTRKNWQAHELAPGLVTTYRQVGTALLVSLSMVHEIGLLNERFFAYYEDDDFSLRAHAAGYASLICMETVVHHEMPSFLRKSPLACYLYARNAYLLWLPRLHGIGRARFLRRQIAATLKLYGDVKNSDEHARAVLQGFLDGINGVEGEMLSRAQPFPTWLRAVVKTPYLAAHVLLMDIRAIACAIGTHFVSARRTHL